MRNIDVLQLLFFEKQKLTKQRDKIKNTSKTLKEPISKVEYYDIVYNKDRLKLATLESKLKSVVSGFNARRILLTEYINDNWARVVVVEFVDGFALVHPKSFGNAYDFALTEKIGKLFFYIDYRVYDNANNILELIKEYLYKEARLDD